MADNSIERFIECLEHSELIAKDELARALAAWKHADPAVFEASQRLADKFVEAKLLTPWQATNLLMGKSAGFFLGPYSCWGSLAPANRRRSNSPNTHGCCALSLILAAS
jgi:hypothetical protein